MTRPSTGTCGGVISKITRLPYGPIAWRLGFGLIVLLILSGMVEDWGEESGGDSAVVAVLADVTNFAFSTALIAFVASFGAWAYVSLMPKIASRAPRPFGTRRRLLMGIGFTLIALSYLVVAVVTEGVRSAINPAVSFFAIGFLTIRFWLSRT